MKYFFIISFITIFSCQENSLKSEWIGNHSSGILQPEKACDINIISSEKVKIKVDGSFTSLRSDIQFFRNDSMIIIDQLGVIRLIVNSKQIFSSNIKGQGKFQIDYLGFYYKKGDSFFMHDNAALKFVVLNLKTFEFSEFPHTFGKNYTFSYLKNDSSMLLGRLGFGKHTKDLPLFWEIRNGNIEENRVIDKSQFDYVQTPYSLTITPISYIENNYFYLPLYYSRNILKLNPENINDYTIFKIDLNIYQPDLVFSSGGYPDGIWSEESINNINVTNNHAFVISTEYNSQDREGQAYIGTTYLRIYNADFSRYYRKYKTGYSYFHADTSYLYSYEFDQRPNGIIDFYIVKNKYEW